MPPSARAWQPVNPQQTVAENHGDYEEFTKATRYHEGAGLMKHILSEELEEIPPLTYGFSRLVEEADKTAVP